MANHSPINSKLLMNGGYALIFVALVAVILLVPREVAEWVFIVSLVLCWRVVTMQTNLHRAIRVPAVHLPAWVRYPVEIGFVLVVIVYFSAHLWDWSPERGLHGPEVSYLAHSGLISGAVFQRTGTIPLWDTLMGTGEPLVEGPFSFVLNPVMLAPFLWLPALQAIKVSVLVHLLLAGAGGWLLAYTLGFRLVGRVMLACLLAANGSMTGAIGGGLFQMGLSQAYVIWVYAGLFGVLYRYSRAYVGVLVISAMLLISAGTFWYALPTAIGCVVIVAVALLHRDERGKWTIDTTKLARVVWASVLIVGLSAARWLPVFVHREFIEHPRERFTDIKGLGAILRSYVETDLRVWEVVSIEYHYIVPALFAVLILLLMLSLWKRFGELPALHVPRVRLIGGTVFLIAFFTLWGYGDLPMIQALYARVDLLSHWRILGRMLAAATPWVAVLVVLVFDDAVSLLAQQSATNLLRVVGVVGVIAYGAVATVDVLRNYERTMSLSPGSYPSYNHDAIYALREANPSGILSVRTADFHDYYPFYETLTRAYNANPDIRIVAPESTLGNRYTMQLPVPYVILFDGIDSAFHRNLGYELSFEDLWYNPNAPDYAFVVPVHRVAQLNRLGREGTLPVIEYHNAFDTIRVVAPTSRDDTALVVWETAYPGWTVTVDGEPAELEVVGSYLGVRLPRKAEDAPPTVVEFRYRPTWFYRGAVMALLSAGLLAVFLLRGERVINRGDA